MERGRGGDEARRPEDRGFHAQDSLELHLLEISWQVERETTLESDKQAHEGARARPRTVAGGHGGEKEGARARTSRTTSVLWRRSLPPQDALTSIQSHPARSGAVLHLCRARRGPTCGRLREARPLAVG